MLKIVFMLTIMYKSKSLDILHKQSEWGYVFMIYNST